MATLSTIIRAVMREHADTTEPQDIAKLVFDAIEPVDVPDVFFSAVVQAVRIHYGVERHENPIIHTTSRKWANASEAYQSMLQRRECVDGNYKLLADCTREDVLWIAQHRYAVADSYVVMGKSYEALATLMTQEGARTVAQLGAERVEQALIAVA